MTDTHVIEIRDRQIQRHEGRDRLHARVSIPKNLSYFRGHFDGFPLLPGVVQLSEVVLPEIATLCPSFGPLKAARRLKFKAMVFPGDELTLELEAQPASLTARFRVLRDGSECSSGALEFSGTDGEK